MLKNSLYLFLKAAHPLHPPVLRVLKQIQSMDKGFTKELDSTILCQVFVTN